jgi:uncharacterized protein
VAKIAVIGSGISGLGCAYLLQKQHDVTVFEANNYVGGHTHTHSIDLQGVTYQVDSGFIVFNPNHYPNFVALLQELGVASQPTQMGFGVKNLKSGLEYNATTINQLFAQRSNLFKPSFWRLITDLKRFYRTPHPLLAMPDPGPTVGEYLQTEGFSEIFAEDHLIPIASALWSSPGNSIREFPAKYLAQFMDNHHMLNTDSTRPPWRVVQGGSQSYTRALQKKLRNPVRLNTKVTRVLRDPNLVSVQFNENEHGNHVETFDQIVFACHSDQALQMLSAPSQAEQSVLGGLRYQSNDTVLHTDASIMPKRRRAWAAWNAQIGDRENEQCTVTYWMNLLQSIQAPVDFLVSLNCTDRIDPNKILKRMRYEHPVYSHQTVQAQRRRAEIQGQHRSYFCGAYWGFGFHEDGLRSAVEVAAELGCPGLAHATRTPDDNAARAQLMSPVASAR